MADPSLVMGQGEEIRNLAAAGVAYLDKRTEFWRQQKPIYARVNEQKAKELKKTQKSTQRATLSSASRGKDSKALAAQLEETEHLLEIGDPESALSVAQSLVKAAEELSGPEKQKFLASGYG